MHHTVVLALASKAPPANSGSTNVIFNSAWITDNLTEIGVVVGLLVGIVMLSRSHKAQSGENFMTLGNVVIAGLVAVSFAVIIAVGPQILATLLSPLTGGG